MRRAALAVLLLAGCVAHGPPRPTLAGLKRNSIYMRPGMPGPEVSKLMGPPQKSAGAPCGASSGRCITWIYVAPNQWGYDFDQLAILFEDSGDSLRVISWQWL